jgi:hypothetical protein
MTKQIKFEIRPNGQNLQLLLRGEDFPQNGKAYERPLPVLNAADIDAFRSGKIPYATFQALGDTVSRWFLDPDLRPLTETWLNSPNPLQLVFAVDQELESKLGDVPLELLEANGELSCHCITGSRASFICCRRSGRKPIPRKFSPSQCGC